MPSSIHVNGPAILTVAFPGGGGGQLGISTDGVDLALNYYDEPVMADSGGPRVPVDIQYMGEDADIRGRLVLYDRDILRALRKRVDSPLEGQLGSMGRLMAKNGHTFALAIASPTDEPWLFPTCILRGTKRAKLGSVKTVWDFSIYAFAYIGENADSKGRPLYTHG